jgi:hypothetical protein
MTCILIVEKNGTIRELKIKTNNVEDYYKKAGFKSDQNFILHHVYDIAMDNVNYSISLYGKIKGKANQENKYEFPPPVDNILFFGNCLLVNNDNLLKTIQPLHAVEWEKIYEILLGGLEDIESENDSDGDDEKVDSELLTKSGYMKNDFIVDDEVIDNVEIDEEEEEEDEGNEDEDNDDDDDDDYDEDNNNSSDEEKIVSRIKDKKKMKVLKKVKKIASVITNVPIVKDKKKKKGLKKECDIFAENRSYLDCSNELSAEEYFRNIT